MSDDEDIAALVIDNGSGMCKGKLHFLHAICFHRLVVFCRERGGSIGHRIGGIARSSIMAFHIGLALYLSLPCVGAY
jgi:hypothetical protein